MLRVNVNKLADEVEIMKQLQSQLLAAPISDGSEIECFHSFFMHFSLELQAQLGDLQAHIRTDSNKLSSNIKGKAVKRFAKELHFFSTRCTAIH